MFFGVFFYIEKDLASARSFSIKYEQRGWEKFFHGQTKGYMFACDQLHAINISCPNGSDNTFEFHFTQLSKFQSY